MTDETAAGDKPNVAGGSASVDHVGYKDGLYRELREIEAAIRMLDGTFEIISQGL